MRKRFALSVAMAAVSVREGRVYPSAAAESDFACHVINQDLLLQHDDRIACIECSSNHAVLVSLERLKKR